MLYGWGGPRSATTHNTNTQRHGDKLPKKTRGVSGRRGNQRHCLKKCSRGGPETSRQSPWLWCPGSRQLHNRRQEVFMTLSSTGKSYDICTNSLGPRLIDHSYVGDMWRWPSLEDLSRCRLNVSMVWRMTCLSRPILQLVAKKNKKEREKCRFL